MTKLFHSLFIFIISSPATVAVIGAVVYVFYGLNKTGSYITAGISLIIVLLIIKHNLKHDISEDRKLLKTLKSIPKNEWLIFGLFILNFLIAIWLLRSGRSDRAIMTPWQVVNSWYFLIYAIGVICLFILSRYSSKLLTISLILQSVLLFSVAGIVYSLGYGFDPYIHEAAVKAIEQFGRIEPLTPYYLGQYSIMTVLHSLTFIGVDFWSRILVPGLAALILPLITMRWLKNHHGIEKDWSLAAILLLLLPAAIFIITTPQNLAYIFLLIVIFWPSQKISSNELIIIWLCALAALITQPIAGIPAILMAIIFSTQKFKLKQYIYSLIIFLLIIALPLAFYIFTTLGAETTVSLNWPGLNFLSNFKPTNLSIEKWWLNFIYLFNGLWGLIILLLAIIGSILTFKKKNLELRQRFVWPALALIISAIITSTINFSFLIDYERSDYAKRIMIIALLIALPLIINTFRELAILIEKSSRYVIITWVIIIVSASSSTLYLSYPRFDHYYNSHGYASSKADSLAVKWIEEDSKDEPYIVLANQQTSAAALREFGFKTYYEDDIFYYPIPTSGPLYQSYLAMIKQPNLAEIKTVRNLTKVKQVYFVLNSYWQNYKKIAAEATIIADTTKDIGDGQIMIFKFSK